jgi:nucleoside-diphosphate-sugar epimerase
VSGSQIKSGAIHVNDVAQAIIKASRSQNTIGKIYNCVDPNSPTWKEYYNTIADELQVRRPWINLPYWLLYVVAIFLEFIYRLFGWYGSRPLVTLFVLYLVGRDQSWPVARAKEDFGWEPTTPFQPAMKEQVQWIKEKNLYLD